MTDDQLRNEIINQLHWDNRLATAEIAVDVHDHEVELKGVVPTYLAQKAAVEDVMCVPGIFSINNQTEIQHPTGVARYSDSEIRRAVEDLLLLNAHIDSERIDVEVTNGVVKIVGEVDAFWKKIRVEDLILDMMHVVAVTNDLVVIPKKNYRDDDIAGGILKAFDRVGNLDKASIGVGVKDGVVHINGKVEDAAVMHALIHIAQNTRGVRDVINELLVGPSSE